MVKKYFYLWGHEGADYKDLHSFGGYLGLFKKRFEITPNMDGSTLGWLIDYDDMVFGKRGCPAIATFFRSLKLTEKQSFNYKHPKIKGFCDLGAPQRNSGLLKKWYDKFYGKKSKNNSGRIS